MIDNPSRVGSEKAKQVAVRVSGQIDIIAYMSGGVCTKRASGGSFLVDAGTILAVNLLNNATPSVSNMTRLMGYGSVSVFQVDA